MSLDYVKFKILNLDIKSLLQSKKLDFKGEYSESTGEILENKLTAHFHYCKVEIFKSGSVYFYGSIHKLFNSLNNIIAPNYKKAKNYKGFNGNQFTLAHIDEVRIYLTKLLHCESKRMVFENIEIGSNLELPFNPQKFLTGLLFHNGTQFEHSRHKRLWIALKNDYRIKVYNKSEQYGMSVNTMRYELHYDRMAKINRLGIKTFADVNAETLNKAHKLLLNEFTNIVYYDNTIRQNKLSKAQKNALNKYNNVRYWIEFLPPNKRYKPKQKLNEIIVNHSDNLKEKILCQIEKTGVIITHSSIGVNLTPNIKRLCPITGLDISMQKEGGKLASNTGFKVLEKTNPKEFEKWVKILLTGNENKFETNIYLKLSKQVRNRYYNNRDLYNPLQKVLF